MIKDKYKNTTLATVVLKNGEKMEVLIDFHDNKNRTWVLVKVRCKDKRDPSVDPDEYIVTRIIPINSIAWIEGSEKLRDLVHW